MINFIKVKKVIERHALSILMTSVVIFFGVVASPVFFVLLGFSIGMYFWEREM